MQGTRPAVRMRRTRINNKSKKETVVIILLSLLCILWMVEEGKSPDENDRRTTGGGRTSGHKLTTNYGVDRLLTHKDTSENRKPTLPNSHIAKMV